MPRFRAVEQSQLVEDVHSNEVPRSEGDALIEPRVYSQAQAQASNPALLSQSALWCKNRDVILTEVECLVASDEVYVQVHAAPP